MSMVIEEDPQLGDVFETTPTMQSIAGAAVHLSGFYAQLLRGLTINAHERLAIAHLGRSGAMTMSELGARIPLSRAAVTALTDRLEGLGYVTRTPDKNDRRRTLLTVTEHPFELMGGISKQFDADLSEFEAKFSEDELTLVRRYMNGFGEIVAKNSDILRARRDNEVPVAKSL